MSGGRIKIMKILFIVTTVMLLVGCSNPVAPEMDICLTIGLDRNIETENNPTMGVIYVSELSCKATGSDLMFYIPSEYATKRTEGTRLHIADCPIVIDSQPFCNLSGILMRDTSGQWYIQIINLPMPIGSKVEIKRFTMWWL